jgi:hypothetical protein
VIQAANNLSDERAQYLINDRLSFMRFPGLSLGDRVPDARTIWLFRERLTRAEIEGRPAVEGLFARFDASLRAAGYIAMSGQIPGSSPRTDATLVAALRQRNTAEEKAEIKAGSVPPEWKAKPATLRHKDRDARWTVKFSKAEPDAKRHHSSDRPRRPSVWVSEPRQHRPGLRGHPHLGGHPVPLLTTAGSCARACWIRRTRPARSGPTRPIARGPTSDSWLRTASSPACTSVVHGSAGWC